LKLPTQALEVGFNDNFVATDRGGAMQAGISPW